MKLDRKIFGIKLLTGLITAAILLACTVAILGCGRQVRWWLVERAIDQRFPDVPTIDTDTLADQLASEASPLIFDARAYEEWQVSHLPNARWIGSEPDAHALAAEIEVDQPIVVYCSVGYRSAGVTERLREAGFTDVHNLQGSIFRWANEGHPIVRPDGEPAEVVHPYDRAWGVLLEPGVRGKAQKM